VSGKLRCRYIGSESPDCSGLDVAVVLGVGGGFRFTGSFSRTGNGRLMRSGGRLDQEVVQEPKGPKVPDPPSEASGR